jgi:hypothetical protein
MILRLPRVCDQILQNPPLNITPKQLLERALGAVCAEHNASAANPTVGVVRLHGALHGDERGAFQEIARQLCGAFGCAFSRTASFDDNLGFLREALGQLRRCARVVRAFCVPGAVLSFSATFAAPWRKLEKQLYR